MSLTAVNTQELAQQNLVQLRDYFTRIPGLNLNGRNSGVTTLDKGLNAIRDNVHLANGLNVHQGRLTSAAVAVSLCLPYDPPDAALAA